MTIAFSYRQEWRSLMLLFLIIKTQYFLSKMLILWNFWLQRMTAHWLLLAHILKSGRTTSYWYIVSSYLKRSPGVHTYFYKGRTFDGHILDLVEFGVDLFTSMDSIPGPKKSLMTKPMISFLGDQWNIDSSYKRMQNLLIGIILHIHPY